MKTFILIHVLFLFLTFQSLGQTTLNFKLKSGAASLVEDGVKSVPSNKDLILITSPPDGVTITEIKGNFGVYKPDSTNRFRLKSSLLRTLKLLSFHFVDNSGNSYPGNAFTLKVVSVENVIHPTKLPFPAIGREISGKEPLPFRNANRYLVIDANPNYFGKKNNVLLKQKDGSLEKRRGIPVRSSLAVIIRGYNFKNFDEATVTINGVDYTYEKDLKSIYDQKELDSEKVEESIGEKYKPISEEEKLEIYLQNVSKHLDSNSFANINEIYLLEDYKNQLKESMEKHFPDFGSHPKILEYYSRIMSWYPQNVVLTPIAIPAVDADEIDVYLKLKEKGKDSPAPQRIGSYRVSGGLGVAVSTNIFFTGLKNNQVYTDSVMVDTTRQLRAMIDDGENKLNIGMGLNTEISFRTGGIIRPTFNAGFFIPFEEDISPFLAPGAGFNIGTSNVKLSFSIGPAFGKVNVISPRYVDRDLSGIEDLANTDLTEKAWRISWQVGFGISYNLKD